MSQSRRFVHEGMKVPFVLLVTCFAAWGVAANMTDPLVQVFSRIFSMSTLQASFVQFAYYGAYFLLALPAAFINRRYSYKTGVLVGLGCAIAGAFLFYPASIAMTYGFFLLALFLLAGGLSILETSANPFVIAMGPEGNATRRLNFAQAFNPVGTNIGVFLSATLILPQLNVADPEERAAMAPEALRAVQQSELQAVMIPYVGFAFVLVALWILIYVYRMPADREEESEGPVDVHFGATLKRLLANRHYSFGVVAQFFNVAGQTCTWTFTIPYVIAAIGGNEAQAGWYLQASLIVFLLSRFAMVWLMGFVRPALLLTIMALLGTGLSLYAVVSPDISGVWAVVFISASLSLMFPTIYGIALHGLGEDTKFGAAGLVMAILGGALMPLVHGATLDAYGAAISYVVPGLCFLVVAAYGVFDLAGKSRAVPADAI
ncbi:FHS family L-fucose permease-like MFS transporter [Palleronia aestuarii]|uniref:FHS family L-fucose permease-like MFS transporter n=1 Tax=Palleronia aestuarii TaxID=568105 RepID=A0A2W7N330_9RHOB|nr:L-fucose:H+ symporter permease [Palleronia aestuarii]PZX14471.1 FHS family L-fucose permease-like MFS transporter [Palleronia aestuarii]